MPVFGVDEAGKGPVLGSMFAAAVVAPSADRLPDGVADSKSLTSERREEIDATIREIEGIAIGLAEVTPGRIDDPATDMNTLTVEAHAEALSAVVRNGMAGTLDASDVDADRFGRRVASRVDADLEVTAVHRAEEHDPLVAAASVVAKVARDAHVRELADEYGELGSGYPGDPHTREFLRQYVADHGTLPPCARASWGTCDDVLAAAEQAALEEF